MGSGLIRYAAGRVAQSVVAMLVVVTFAFFLLRLTGDPAALLLPPSATEADLLRLRQTLGLDRPLYVQYFDFLAGVLRGDFGNSLRHGTPAMSLVLQRLPATMELTLASILVTLVVGLPLGIAAAVYRGSVVDSLARIVAVAAQCIPIFWLGVVLIQIFAVKLQVLPSSGRGTLAHLIMPAVTLAAYSLPVTTRILRSNLLDVLNRDFIRTARAKGLPERVVLFKHALRNAAIPVVTVFALRIGMIIGGAVITENVFAYPGMGRLALQAIGARDFPVLQSFVIVMALIIVLLNLVVDLLYAWLDPRVRYTS